ncbi:MAG: hypothetical protein LBD23_00005, partial [Oscillospiraceae bacterium]|nr:hypothetical protein [Oscillospiraceae bacterium]
MMNHKQAVIDAIKHKNGKLPYNVELTSEKRRDLCAQIGIDEKDYFSWAGNHIEKADYNFGEFVNEG